ncbi:hypothetical protein ACQPYK_49415 (plasmid) [Streptosporangium sp. CA-135522]|uniref:hypothetical protein n=1 Tax=Streptosporangium sp. CA-135522 TaxID=3240072 RepID=UPI003D8ECF02
MLDNTAVANAGRTAHLHDRLPSGETEQVSRASSRSTTLITAAATVLPAQAPAEATGVARIRAKVARAIELAFLMGAVRVDAALGLAAIHGLFSESDLASIRPTCRWAIVAGDIPGQPGLRIEIFGCEQPRQIKEAWPPPSAGRPHLITHPDAARHP